MPAPKPSFIPVDIVVASTGAFAVFYADDRLDATRALVLEGVSLSARLPSGYLVPLGNVPERLAEELLEARTGIFARRLGAGTRGRDVQIRRL